MAAPRTAPQRPEPKRRFSRPVFDELITIQSDHAQRLIQRGLYQVSSALYAIDVILRIIGNNAEMDQVEVIVNASLNDFALALRQEQEKMELLRTQHGITRIPRYEAPRTLTVHVYSPQMGQYCALIQSLDQLMVTIDTLWMNGVLASNQRVNAAFAWRVRLLRIGREIINLARRARESAQRQGRADEVAAETGAALMVLDHAVLEDDAAAA